MSDNLIDDGSSWSYNETMNQVEYYNADMDCDLYYYPTSYDRDTNTAMIYYDNAEFYSVTYVDADADPNEGIEEWHGYEALYFKIENGERVVYAFEWEAEEAESIPTWSEILEQADRDAVGWYLADDETWFYSGSMNIIFQMYNDSLIDEFGVFGYDSANNIGITQMCR